MRVPLDVEVRSEDVCERRRSEWRRLLRNVYCTQRSMAISGCTSSIGETTCPLPVPLRRAAQ